MQRIIFLCLLAILTGLAMGCKPNRYQRFIAIESEPSGAIVWLNDQEVGITPLEVPFVWYGTYDVVIRKQGYQSLWLGQKTKRPVTQWPGLDFFFEIIWPLPITDRQNWHFTLEPLADQDSNELIEKARALQ